MDRNSIIDALAVTVELTGTDLSQGARKAMVAELERYDPGAVVHALERCRRELRGRLSLSDILDRLPGQWPGVEEAWARVPKTEDESGMLFEEMARAWSVARPLYDQGDAIGARMAFKEAYEREVAQAKGEGRMPNWFFSPGFDKEGRASAIHKAQSEGLIGSERANALLEQHAPHAEPDAGMKQIAHQVAQGDAESAARAIEDMRQTLGDRKAS